MKVQVQFMGRFGNQLFQYCFARGYAERIGARFEADPWIGQRIFDLNDYSIESKLPISGEDSLDAQPKNVCWSGYFQQQRCIDYFTKYDVQRWLKIRLDVADKLTREPSRLAFHLRRGDYMDSGYPVVSLQSYVKWADKHGYALDGIGIYSDDYQHTSRLPHDIAFVDDFVAMARSSVLFRANSSFSWWAGAWGNCDVYSPMIDGIAGGREVDVPFIAGNHPKLADLHFITELKLQ